ncbi:MAG: three-Cys-motif partner protein TcmP [Bacteroidaceae bacterium]|nr:three-Cys-motif partner protein TcmP [Bacteroidaceae bacterium]
MINYKEFDEAPMSVAEPSSWGGQWTEDKLDAFEKYVKAYLTIMNSNRDKYRWKLIYFDGFAGSGSRTVLSDNNREENSLFAEYNILDEVDTYKGAAERVLNIEQRGFDSYFFVDKDNDSSKKLQQKLSKYEDSRELIFITSDANAELHKLADRMRRDKSISSLVLLDPFGMQVDWASIENLRNTRTDLWILIPTGIIVNRLLDKNGELTHIERLKSFFGKDEGFLREYFYRQKQEQTLFGEINIIEKIEHPIKRIAELYIQRLGEIFKNVTPEPLVLFNRKHTPIFHFACASNNQTAIKIASEIIGKKQRK